MNQNPTCEGCDGFGVVDGLEPCPDDCPKSREVIALLRERAWD